MALFLFTTNSTGKSSSPISPSNSFPSLSNSLSKELVCCLLFLFSPLLVSESLAPPFLFLIFTFTVLPNKSVCSCLAAATSMAPAPPLTENSSPKILLPKVLNSNSLKISARADLFFSFNLKSSS